MVAAGLLFGGAVVFFRGTDTTSACQPDPLGWNGPGGGAAHTGSSGAPARAHGVSWAPDWITATPATDTDRLTAPPAAASGAVYSVSADGDLVALGEGDGHELWRSAADAAGAGAGTVPVGLDGCAALVVTRTGSGGAVRAVSLDAHRQEWLRASAEPIAGGAAVDAHTAYVGVTGSTTASGPTRAVVGLALADGGTRIERALGTSAAGSPAVGGGRVYATSVDGTLVALSVDPATQSTSQLWSLSLGGAAAAGPVETADGVLAATTGGSLALVDADGRLRWRANAGGPVEVPPVRGHTLIAAGSRDGRITALSSDGAVRWTRELHAVVTGLAVAGDDVVVATQDGVLRVLDPAGGADISSWHAGAALVGAPALSGGRVLVVTADGRLAALPL